jgi:hypothetical protein
MIDGGGEMVKSKRYSGIDDGRKKSTIPRRQRENDSSKDAN